jgi:hypothetical protein
MIHPTIRKCRAVQLIKKEVNAMPYQVYMVENYVLRYDQKNDRPWIIFHYKVDGQWKNVNWFPPKENAVYIADMLRNEKPVYWVPDGGYLTTSTEVVGEEEKA